MRKRATTCRRLALVSSITFVGLLALCARSGADELDAEEQPYEHEDTRELVGLVNDAAVLVERDGEAAFDTFRVPDSRWRHDETYLFVVDLEGNMLVHPDEAMEGTNQIDLEDINGRPIIRGLIDAATAVPREPHGWYHYEWAVPGQILPRWKSSYVRLVTAPSGERLVVGAGMYDDRMERAFVVHMVRDAVAEIEKGGVSAFPLLRDRTGRFFAKDGYVFVIDQRGVALVHPGFPNLEGRNIVDVEDTEGKPLVREMLDLVSTRGAGWVDYMWPKPGESVSTQKSTYVTRANLGGEWVLVGSGVYLADAPTVAMQPTLTAPELEALVREAAAVFEEHGADAFPEFRREGSRWFRDGTYFFAWNMDGTRVFHAANPSIEGKDASAEQDVLGRPYGRMFLEVAASSSGEGWVHYMYPEPGDIFPTWKSTFVKRVRFPSGEEHLVGAGIYNMQMDEAFIEDVVERAASLVASRGPEAFDELRNERGPYFFMDTYVFVDEPDGTELVNPGQPSLEGRNILDLEDARGTPIARSYIDLAMEQGSGWVEYYWYRPGENTPTRKRTYVRKVQAGDQTYIVGSGLYLED